MCFYDQTVFSCGDSKWGNFRAHCTKEYRTGETCGMRLINESYHVQELCKICDKIVIKERRIGKEQSNIRRWKSEGKRFRANIEKSEELIAQWENDILKYKQMTYEKRIELN